MEVNNQTTYIKKDYIDKNIYSANDKFLYHISPWYYKTYIASLNRAPTWHTSKRHLSDRKISSD
jgi:hypothetical protein